MAPDGWLYWYDNQLGMWCAGRGGYTFDLQKLVLGRLEGTLDAARWVAVANYRAGSVS